MSPKKITRSSARAKPAKAKSPRRIASSRTAQFEKMLRQTAVEESYELKLYVAGASPRSGHAIANIRSLCEEYLPGRYDLEVIDIYQQPAVAVSEQIVAAPTLIKKLPAPSQRMIGDLSNRDKILIGLNIVVPPPKTAWVKV
jgi:circadian clock protein KaiB